MTKRLISSKRAKESNRLEKLHAAIAMGITHMHSDQLEEFTALFVETLPREDLESRSD